MFILESIIIAITMVALGITIASFHTIINC